ncbi:halocyanin domain-containing protein [Halopenitus persicus]|uniref:Halocyanin domain-containing protein n=1 Tax=Halopenitus persicus TaxID=1048396 RepID=A0A1H3DLR1_9EURY|nr:halocyanin domain-containing protein [Halopenitus persicus]SDX66589.1 halocyanin domain-containing protein [Halopenitus persicus]
MSDRTRNAGRSLDRRTYLSATAAVGATLLAGCSGGGNGNGGGNGGNGGGGNGGNGNGGGNEYLSEEPNYDGWFDDVSNYEGQTLDRRDADSVTVDVGAGDGLQFAPPAVAVSTGTTVTWEWTGQGGQHNVAAEDGSFESEQTNEEGHTFEHTFESAGTYTYICTPHEAVGMKGAIVVE